MDNTINYFIDACNIFRITPNAKSYIEGKIKLPTNVSETFSKDWSKKVPALDLKKVIFPILEQAEDSLALGNNNKNSLFSILNIEQRFSTTEVIIITEKDNNRTIPVYNRNWLLLSAENKATHSIFTECTIPESGDDTDQSKLGCYLLNSGTVLMWIDRICRCANNANISIELLFQKVLLHELFHAVLDCNPRSQKLDVFCADNNIKGIEETLDNILVLKSYRYAGDEICFNSIKNFITTQPSNYALAAEVFEKIYSHQMWNQLNGFITIFYLSKISGTVKTNNTCMYFVVADDDEDSRETPKDIIECLEEMLIPLTVKGLCLKSDYEEFQSCKYSARFRSGIARITIKGDIFILHHIDFISDITIKDDVTENLVRAVFILKNENKDEFIICSYSFFDIDKQDYIDFLKIIGMEETRDGLYCIEDNPCSRYRSLGQLLDIIKQG